MALTFYPHTEDAQRGSLADRMGVLMDSAERYKSVILDASGGRVASTDIQKRMIPRDQTAAYNWEEIARVLRELRELPEISKADKIKKADMLTKLAEIYEVLRGAKMTKLEAIRLALVGEANQLRGNASQVT